jgi:hypothetical protein
MRRRLPAALFLVAVASALAIGARSPSRADPAPGPASAPTTAPTTAPATRPASAKPIYNCQNTLESLCQPVLTPITWAHVSYYADNPTKRADPTLMLGIPPENIRQFARLCRDGGILKNGWQPKGIPIVAGAPVVLDWEGGYDEAKLDVFAEYVRIFRAEAPELKVSVNAIHIWYGFILEQWRDGLTAEQIAQVDKGVALTRPITDQCDFISGGGYLSAPEAIERDMAAFRAQHDLIRAKYPGKPLYVFISPRWTHHKARDWREGDGWTKRVGDVVLDRASATRLLDFAAQYDATILWSEDWRTIEQIFLPLVKARARK